MANAKDWPAVKRKLIAILRGIRPDETETIVSELIEAGFEAIEIPLNSPEPFRSLQIAVQAAEAAAPGACLVGSGTVLSEENVTRIADCGGTLVVSPNVDTGVIKKTVSLSMISMPGVFTATEALAAASVGASALKFFPATVLGPAGINAVRAVLPENLALCAVGGISENDFARYQAVGINGFGLGSSLYAPGRPAAEIRQRADKIIGLYDAVFST